jgi:hypothetical protein
LGIELGADVSAFDLADGTEVVVLLGGLAIDVALVLGANVDGSRK